MANSYYNASGNPATGSEGLSALMRNEFLAISAAFDLVPRIATTGLFDTVFNQLGSYTFTLPNGPGTIATIANIATETARATAAEAAEVTARAAADTAEVTARNTAIGVETARATTAEGLLAPKASPALTGTPTAPTAAPGTNTTQLATTAFATAAAAALVSGVASVAGKTGVVTLVTADVSGAAPLASPTLTGTPLAPTAAALTNTTQIATTAFTTAAVAVETARAVADTATKANVGGQTFTGGIAATSVLVSSAGIGQVTLSPGDATHTGYVRFLNAAGVSQGYVGFATASSTILLANEGTATGYNVTGLLNVAGALAVGGSTTTTGVTYFGAAGTFYANPNSAGTQLINFANSQYLQYTPAYGFTLATSSGNIALSATTVTTTGAAVVSGNLNVNGAMGVIGLAGFSGSIAVQTTSTANPLAIFAVGAGATIGSITTNGSTTAYNTSSDYRLKVTFGRWLDGAAFDAVAVHNARFKLDAEPPRAMFLAHELQTAGFGYAVTGEKDATDVTGAILSQMVDHSLLVPALWAMVQELRGRVALLEAR